MSSSVLVTAIINGLLTGGVYSLVAVGLTLIWGVMGVANFAHGAFLMVGMYAAYWLFVLTGLDPFLGLFAAMGLMFAVGWYMQKYLINKIMDAPHYNQFLLTIGIAIFLENLALFLWPDYRQLKVSYQSAAISLGAEHRIELVRLFAFIVAGILSIALYYFLKLTDLGKAIRSTSQNKIGAQVVGINVRKVNILTFAIGAACAGGAGAVITPYYPTSYTVGNLFILIAFVVVCIGGMGNLVGAMIGGLIIGLAESIGTLIIPGGQKELITYTIFIAILLFRPQGLFPYGGYWQAQKEEQPPKARRYEPVSALESKALSRFSISFYYWILGGAILALLLVIPLFRNNYLTHVVLEMLLLAYLGQAWNIMCGYTGQLSFGHATFFGIGAYTSSLLFVKLGISPWIGMFLGGCLALTVGVGIGKVSLRYGVKGVFFAFSTLCVAEIFRLLSLFWVSLTNGARGILLPWGGHNPWMFSFAVHKKYLYYYTVLGMLLGCTLIAHKIKKIRFGFYLFAIRGNEDAAESLGVDTAKYRTIAIAISAFLTALGGTFYVQYYQHFEPEEVFGPLRSFDLIFPVILGGGGNIMGPVIGAFVLHSFEEITRAIMPPLLHGFHNMLYGVLIVLMIMYLPTGIVSLIEDWKDRMVSRYKIRT